MYSNTNTKQLQQQLYQVNQKIVQQKALEDQKFTRQQQLRSLQLSVEKGCEACLAKRIIEEIPMTIKTGENIISGMDVDIVRIKSIINTIENELDSIHHEISSISDSIRHHQGSANHLSNQIDQSHRE